jgi:hypothetical protein
MHCQQAGATMPPRKLIFHQINDGSGKSHACGCVALLKASKNDNIWLFSTLEKWLNLQMAI